MRSSFRPWAIRTRCAILGHLSDHALIPLQEHSQSRTSTRPQSGFVVRVWNLGRGRQSQRRRRRAELLELSFQPSRDQQDQHAHLIGMDLKGVRDAAQTEDQRAGRAADGVIADPRGDLAFKDVEALVLVAVDVARRQLPLRVSASISANRPWV
jgi:uncharacterized protein YjiS (DUF1127 family)